MAPEIRPFQIAVPDSGLEELKKKLSQARLPQEVSFSNDWSYGVPLSDVKRLVNYWQNGYNWRKHEAELNKLPQFTTIVDVDKHEDLEIHFIHQKSTKEDAIPLLFCHGWPGGFWEGIKMLPTLSNPTSDDEPSFHVVIPSLPNFGFSQGASKPDFGITQFAETAHKLMLQLGYEKYATQGGDWGYIITRVICKLYPAHVLASHLNFIRVDPPTLSSNPSFYLQNLLSPVPYTAAEKAGLARTAWFYKEGFGYNQEHSTKPHTIGFGLADSPVALLAWIYEKLVDWTDAYPWTDDEILTWINLYLFSRSGPAASVRIYFEAQHASDREAVGNARKWNGKVKLGLSHFPRDIIVVPSRWGKTMGPVVFEARHEDGGHFAAFEKPEVLAEDLKKMFEKKGALFAEARKKLETAGNARI